MLNASHTSTKSQPGSLLTSKYIIMINVYTDTSVIGGCYDPEFREWSQALFNEFETGTKKMLISDLMIAELSKPRKE